MHNDIFVIGVPVAMDGYGWCDGWQVDLDTLLMLRPGHDLLFRTSNNLDLIAVTLSREELCQHARTVDGLEIGQALDNTGSALRNPALAAELRNFLINVAASLGASPSMLAHAPIRKGLKEAMLTTVVSVIGNIPRENSGPAHLRGASTNRLPCHRLHAHAHRRADFGQRSMQGTGGFPPDPPVLLRRSPANQPGQLPQGPAH